jgi:hypothetical protein
LAAGLLIGYAAARLNSESELAAADHFARLRSLPPGTKVLVCYNNNLILGDVRGSFFDRIERRNGVNVEYKIGSRQIIDPYHERTAAKIFVLPPYIASILTSNGKFLSGVTAFANFMARDSRIFAKLISAPPDGLVICGDKNHIVEEANSGFELPKEVGHSPVGQFNAILQLEGFRGTVLP